MNQVVILAGGAGTRLRPLTLNTPKPMIDINGKPFLQFIIEYLKTYGLTDFLLCVGYLSDKFIDYFGDGSRLGVNISYSIEKEFVGTGGALKLASKYLDEEFFVVNGDTYLSIDYRDVYLKYKREQKTGLLVLYDNHEFAAEPNIALDGNGNVLTYQKREKLKKGEREIKQAVKNKTACRFIDAGVQVFKKDILDLMPDKVFVSLEVDVFPQLIRQGELASYITSQRFYDLGTPERLESVKGVLS